MENRDCPKTVGYYESPFFYLASWETFTCIDTVLMISICLYEKERKNDILTSFKRPKWPIRPNKRLHLDVVSSLRTTNQNKVNITP